MRRASPPSPFQKPAHGGKPPPGAGRPEGPGTRRTAYHSGRLLKLWQSAPTVIGHSPSDEYMPMLMPRAWYSATSEPTHAQLSAGSFQQPSHCSMSSLEAGFGGRAPRVS